MKTDHIKLLLQDLADLHEELDKLLEAAIAEPLSAEGQVRQVERALEALRSFRPRGWNCAWEAQPSIECLRN